MQRRLEDMKSCLAHMKAKLAEKEKTLVEPKQDVGMKKVQVVLDSAAITPLMVGFLGVLVGVIVGVLWK